MYHIFFIHSSVHGHLGCFRVLATVNSAAVNIGVRVSFQVMVLNGFNGFNYGLGVGLLDLMVLLSCF